MPKKGDSRYFEDRLKRDHTAIYKLLLGGYYPSVRQAAAAAGLIRLPTSLDHLMREWKRAAAADQVAFLRWLKGGAATTPRIRRPIVNASGRLTPDAVNFLQTWSRGRNATPGQIMKEIGFSNHDYRLAHALNKPTALHNDVVAALEPWMRRNGFR